MSNLHLVHVTMVFLFVKDLVGVDPSNKFKRLYKRKGVKVVDRTQLASGKKESLDDWKSLRGKLKKEMGVKV
uniref:Uncharacterized protein n=1 Tax=Nelumbo nucifera TaxID=4432 RepID=A0A822Z8T6_NELNU|nr:TPA_asm: hypothetical protein HUJ06_008559 [Nelumbo nucifera]